MKSNLLIILLCFFISFIKAQNPVSYPKDTLLSSAELNFEVLWHTFEDNYAFFKLRNIDWKRTYTHYRPMVSTTTSDDSLYMIFSAMLAPFQDNHINVIVPGVKQFKSIKPSQFVQEFPTDSLRNAFQQMVNQALYKKGFNSMQSIGQKRNNKALFDYTTSKDIGYLRFNRCFVDGDADNVPDAIVAGKILDTLLENFKNVKGLIIDVRDNIGGNDEFAYEVADRFTREKMVGNYIATRKRGGGYEEFGNPETWFMEPKGKYTFQNPVVVLTNDKTVSAGDVFAMIMRELPQVKIIGTNTRGIYSNMYGFTLPNKWLISLSNQKYCDAKMVCYEGGGTPVDVEVKNTKSDLATGKDPVLDAACRNLSKRTVPQKGRKH